MSSSDPNGASGSSNPPTSELVETDTLEGLLARDAALVAEASEALPHSFDQCTYIMGPLRQAVYWCKTCETPAGICSACSIACHGDHEQVELFPKRDFVCDCPTSCLSAQCTLHKVVEARNESNRYGHNFKGEFCRCGRNYDAATEEETMVQCISCEDWFHESCLNLRNAPSSSASTAPPSSIPASSSNATIDTDADAEEDEEEVDPTIVLKASQYESLVCGECVKYSPLFSRWAGSPGCRMIVWSAEKEGWVVRGDDAERPDTEAEVEVNVLGVNGPSTSSANEAAPSISGRSTPPSELKRPAPPSSPGVLSPARKRRRASISADVSTSSPFSKTTCKAPPRQTRPDPLHALAQNTGSRPFAFVEREKPPRDGDTEADLFLSEGWRERWCRCPDCIGDLKAAWLTEDIEVYEPPEDPDANISLEELGMRALEKLPREKTLDGIRAYNSLRDELLSYLRPFADGKKVVGEADVKSFFAAKMAELGKR